MRISLDQVKRIGGLCFEAALGVFLVAVLVASWNSSRAKPESSSRAGVVNTASVNALLPLQGTTCIQVICIEDDSSDNQLAFCKETGEYTFTNCNSFSLTGVGVVSSQGSVITLEHTAPDRRLTAGLDLAAKRARASVQTFTSPRIFKTITDRDTSNDVCGCNGTTH